MKYFSKVPIFLSPPKISIIANFVNFEPKPAVNLGLTKRTFWCVNATDGRREISKAQVNFQLQTNQSFWLSQHYIFLSNCFQGDVHLSNKQFIKSFCYSLWKVCLSDTKHLLLHPCIDPNLDRLAIVIKFCDATPSSHVELCCYDEVQGCNKRDGDIYKINNGKMNIN